MKIKFPIRYKFLFFTTLLLVFCVVSYLLLASRIFKRDKVELVFDLNRGAVSGLAADVGSQFRGIADKMKLAAVLSIERDNESLLQDVLKNDGQIVYMAASYAFRSLDNVLFSDAEFASTYAVSEDYFAKRLAAERRIPFDEIRTSGEAVWNATLKDGPPLIGFGKSVVAENDNNADKAQTATAPFALVAYVRADRLLKALSESRVNEIIAVNRHGQILAHPHPDEMIKGASLAGHPLYRLATSRPIRTAVSRVTWQGASLLGAYSVADHAGIIVLSQIDEANAFSAVESLVQRSLLFAMIAVTLAFIGAIFFSRSLTQPIQCLVEAMKDVSSGELNARIEHRSNDEIAILAASFNSMISDLQVSRQALEEANRDLEQKVKDRTKRLEEQNVAVKKAQEALLNSTRLAAVGEVAGRAAHEVLNPLTSIITRLEKVRSRLQSRTSENVALAHDIVQGWESEFSSGGFEKLVESWKAPSAVDGSQSLWQEDFENVKHFESEIRGEVETLVGDADFLLKESHRINKIVQNMRSLTRVRGDLSVQPVAGLMHDAVTIMADLCLHSDIVIREEYVDDLAVEVDVDEFAQVATNLLRNSIQAIQARTANREPGEIVIVTGRSGDEVFIDIKDNGVGINHENRSKLFEVQFSTKPKEEGTGLGLSISRRFIRAFGGDIRLFQSAPGEGCVFRITLPLAIVDESARKVAV